MGEILRREDVVRLESLASSLIELAFVYNLNLSVVPHDAGDRVIIQGSHGNAALAVGSGRTEEEATRCTARFLADPESLKWLRTTLKKLDAGMQSHEVGDALDRLKGTV